jgi:hypothetical protein
MGSLPEGSTLLFEDINGLAIYVYAPSLDDYLFYSTNGTPDGATLILGLGLAPDGYVVGTLPSDTSGIGFFETYFNGALHLYGTDGTAAGTQELFSLATSQNFNSEINFAFAVGINNFTAFIAVADLNYTVYSSDGTTAGTQVLFTFGASSTSFSQVFAGDDRFNGKQTWYTQSGSDWTVYATDGTAAGTQKIITYDTPSDSTSSIGDINAYVNGREFFVGISQTSNGNVYTVYG